MTRHSGVAARKPASDPVPRNLDQPSSELLQSIEQQIELRHQSDMEARLAMLDTSGLLAPTDRTDRDRLAIGQAAWRESSAITRTLGTRAATDALVRERSPHVELPFDCLGTWLLIPPYQDPILGVPAQPPVESATPGTTTQGQPSLLHISSSWANAEEGWISLGAAVGRFWDYLYPAQFHDRLGDYNSSWGSLRHVVRFPGPASEPTTAYVTVDVRLPTTPSLILDKVMGSSVEDGPVVITGTFYLYLYDIQGGAQTLNTKTFFSFIWSQGLGVIESNYEPFAPISGAFDLPPGASGLGINLNAFLTTWLPGRFENLTQGIAGADFRAPASTHGIWILRPPAGPIRVPQMRLTLCRVFSPRPLRTPL